MNCNCKYNFTDDGKKLSPRRDVPSYPKVKKKKKPTMGRHFLDLPMKPRQSVRSMCNRRRLVLTCTQYTLSQETIETLKKPTFDVWHWEHNEVCLLMNGCVLDIQSAFVWLCFYYSHVSILRTSILNLIFSLTRALIGFRC